MKKINVIYFSNSGNTEEMANAVVKGAEGEDIAVKLITFGEATEADVLDADAVAMGCPACGAEELDEDDVYPFLDKIKDKISGKQIALFGSYGWGGGPWMETWKADMESYGVKIVGEPVIANDAPDDEALAACEALGASLKTI